MSAHTPGPWVASIVCGGTNGWPSRVVVGPIGRQAEIHVAMLRGDALANANLIAAAPELLAAVEAALADLDAALRGRRPPRPQLELAQLFRTAIAKARGAP
jgi:citrate lyase beta subunit